MGSSQDQGEVRSVSRIVSSSLRMGLAHWISLACGLLRSKVIAILLGPEGLGLFTTLMSIRAMAQSISDLGVSSSGVRQIALASAADDPVRLGEVAMCLRRVSVLSALVGSALLAAFSGPVSRLVFGTGEYRAEVALMGLALFLTVQAAARKAVVQGVRRVRDLSRMAIITSLAGMLVAVVSLFAFGIQGVAPALVAIALIDFGVSWIYSRRVVAPATASGWRASFTV